MHAHVNPHCTVDVVRVLRISAEVASSRRWFAAAAAASLGVCAPPPSPPPVELLSRENVCF